MGKIECKKYDKWGDCVEWDIEGDVLVGRLDPMAKSCSPKLYKEAQNHLKNKHVRVEL